MRDRAGFELKATRPKTYASVSTWGHFLRLVVSCWAPAAVNLLYCTLGRETHPGTWPWGPSSPRPRPWPCPRPPGLSPARPMMSEGDLGDPKPQATATHCPGPRTYSSTRRDVMSGSTRARLSAPTSQMQLLYKLSETEVRAGARLQTVRAQRDPCPAGITAPVY